MKKRFVAFCISAFLAVMSFQSCFAKSEPIVVAGAMSQSLHESIIKSNPDLDALLVSGYDIFYGDMITSLLSKDDSFDVYVLFTGNYDIQTLFRKGYSNAVTRNTGLCETIAKMLPSIKEAVTYEGVVMAVPLEVWSMEAGYNKQAFEKLEIPIPTNWEEMAKLINEWRNQPQEVLGKYQIANTFSYRKWYLKWAMDRYITYYQYTDMPLNFDTLLFRKIMETVECMTNENDLTDDDFSIDELEPLILSEYDLLSSAHFGDTPFLPILMDENTQPHYRGMLMIGIVNPNSKNIDGALHYLELCLAEIGDDKRFLLFANETSPIESPLYPPNKLYIENQIATLEDAMQRDDPSLATTYQEQIERYRLSLEDLENYRYMLTEEDIAYYQSIAPGLFFPPPSILDDLGQENTTHVIALINRYIDGNLNSMQFIEALQKITKMIQAEME